MQEHQTDYSQITDQIYIGSDLCKGPSCPVHSVEFKKLGICAEINLERERDETPTPGVDVYVWLPTEDHTAPTLDQLMIGTGALDQMIRLGMTVYVHCRNGHGRSPTLVVAYLVRYRKMTLEQAIEAVRSKRPEMHLEPAQEEALKQFYNSFD